MSTKLAAQMGSSAPVRGEWRSCRWPCPVFHGGQFGLGHLAAALSSMKRPAPDYPAPPGGPPGAGAPPPRRSRPSGYPAAWCMTSSARRRCAVQARPKRRLTPSSGSRSSCAAWCAPVQASVPALSMSASNSSGVGRDADNHWSISRRSTGLSQRQQQPSTTCSLASTVWSVSHQLTSAFSGRPGLSNRRVKNHCSQR